MSNQATVLDVKIDSVTMNSALSIAERFIAEKKPHMIATANAEMVMLAHQDSELAGILGQSDLVLPDGAGVVWAARYLGYTMPERVAGYDFTQQLLARSAEKGYRVYMFGSKPEIIEKARENAITRYPGLNIVGVRHGYYTAADEQAIIDDVIAKNPDILLVALGIPKQEKWIAKNMYTLKIPINIGVGGTFDGMAGVVKRAPLWMQQANLEWLFRLLLQPQRIVRMRALPEFALRVMLSGKKC
ncbi:MAG TPA: WecB/TagA/CpsF family glycosyltransferase [Methylomusa anaerophila]|uniref:N-acetylglucosaminyldiphosphoundecaprenol N-acetyl-beta-D-mannosaminyltransferase n=1 Tax=Methylomusa anaerophila TaxID=1930071 RepID=A0A348APR0_9FIRM|nr:WecB/TagA/CpsF family glycosyltransferase [Methylomusa anaerophila]BBB93058.1 putative N-acetylmannosaminyltransferase [Methylomusa anaerophila]HML87109.1 WecB/TagA/CpsF family glycosyltransferase [Methylomusa anaerophila]